jgi:hypothetical protein
MIQVYVELSNIQWEGDEDGDIKYEQGTDRCFVADIPDHCDLSSEDIDEAIADSLEHHTGHRPTSWTLQVFDDTLEMV